MTMLSLPTTLQNNPALWLATRLGVAAGFALAADGLFYDRPVGLSLPLFLATLAAAAVPFNRAEAAPRLRLAALAFFALNLLALIEAVNWLSAGLAIFGLAATALVVATGETRRWRDIALQAALLPLLGGVRFVDDALRALRLARERNIAIRLVTAPLALVMPALLFAVFLYLFAEANPLIDAWLGKIDLRFLLDLFSQAHPLFWLAVAWVVWPMLHLPELPPRPTPPAAPRAMAPPVADADDLFGPTAFLRSLFALNALFALQSGLDLVYLWGGLALPGGMSYAEYAHRGAYPLVATALLAAIVVLAAMRPGGPAESKPLIRPLVLAFAAQNILLTMSSLLRLNLYVEAYGLTQWRLAAFVWFALVALGLVSIVAQIVLGKSLSWLLAWNAAALAATLYLCCFLNFPAIVAEFDVDHSFEATGHGPRLDLCYLQSLGPDALPALDRIGDFSDAPEFRGRLARLEKDMADWRSWSFRGWRLQRHLDARPSREALPPQAGCGRD